MERHFDDGTEPTILPHYSRCTGPCDQGRKPCPCPISCETEQALGESTFRLLGQAFLAVILAAVIVVLLAVGL